jgi:hypothetical protein
MSERKRRATRAPVKVKQGPPKRLAKRATIPQVAVFRPEAADVSLERKTLAQVFGPGNDFEALSISPTHTLWVQVLDPSSEAGRTPNLLFRKAHNYPAFFPELAGIIVLAREPPKSIGEDDVKALPKMARQDILKRNSFRKALGALGAETILM